MPVIETFSKRKKKREQAGAPVVYQYDSLPQAFRVQVAHIWDTSLGDFDPHHLQVSQLTPSHLWRGIHNTVARELGVFELGQRYGDFKERCVQHLLTADIEDALDIIELSFRVIDSPQGLRAVHPWYRESLRQDPEDAIEELNHRFREHGIGYQFVGRDLVKVDSQYVHAEVVEPAVRLLHQDEFRGPSDEFLRAHEHYRKGRHKEAVAEALKAFESTMKAICDARGWAYPANATAIPLVKVLIDNGLVPSDLQSHFGSLRAAMESGLPTISNKTSRHGQGAVPRPIPEHIASYALHLAAANIVFLVRAHEAMGKRGSP